MFIEYKSSPRFRPPSTPSPQVYLIHDNWNDWRDWHTLYTLAYVDEQGEVHYIGGVKIGRYGMSPKINNGRPEIPESFDSLDDKFFSLGQDVSYYENVNQLGEEMRLKIFAALKDVAFYPDLFEKAYRESVMRESLLRGISQTSVREQFNRLAHGDAKLTRYKFEYITPDYNNSTPMNLQFHVIPDSNPPTNIHALIGRNGVGKTRMLYNMISSLTQPYPEKYGSFSTSIKGDIFANLVSVSFSAFDKSEPLPEQRDKTKGIQYSYVGLKRRRKNSNSDYNSSPKSPEELKKEFVSSAKVCRIGYKKKRWVRAIEMLETDPVFNENEFSKVAELDDASFLDKAPKLFDDLSSGHKIVLLTITKLVETVEERSLVLLDEPEGHLHPPLLSAFTRALSDLLIRRNGVAIIATHSPVVLQEVPKSCVWILQRAGNELSADRPEIETFGENIGVLTRAVFGLEVTHSGFNKLISGAVDISSDYEEVVDLFNGELGMEARAIIQSLLASRIREERDQDA